MASEHQQEHDQEQPAAEQPAQLVTPGQLLRAAREEKQWTTQQVASTLRLRISLIAQIEADNYHNIEPAAYVRGYLRLMAKALDVDENQVMEAYQQMGYAEVPSAAINMKSFSKRKTRERNDHRLMLISYLIIGVVIAMAVLWWWQDIQADGVFGTSTTSSSRVTTATSPATPVAQPVSPSADVVEDTLADDDDLFDLADDEPHEAAVVVLEPEQQLEQQPAQEQAQQPAQEQEQVVADEPASASVVGEPTLEAGQASLVLTFSGECWVKVTDGTGRDIAIGVKAAGYEMPLTGTPPFDIILCKPEFVTLVYNDEPVDLSGYRRNRSVTLTLD